MRRIVWKKFAGVKKSGTIPIEKPFMGDIHIKRIMWLTAMVESGGKYGCALNYDGTGATAGLHQAIAVYPRALDDGKRPNDQGSLWQLLHNCKGTSRYMDFILEELRDWDMVVTPDGKLRYNSEVDKLVSGKEIREVLTGSKDGVMPIKGPDRARAERFIDWLSKALSQPETFKAQHDHGARFVYKRADRWGISISDDFDEEWDLASAMFWSYCVNAPAIARRIFAKHGHDPGLLIKALGKSKFGRWSSDIRGGRYQRTRKYALRLWPRHLFVGSNAICPEKFR